MVGGFEYNRGSCGGSRGGGGGMGASVSGAGDGNGSDGA